MKCRLVLLWLLAVSTLAAFESRAESVIQPSEGISRTTYFGSIDNGPPGVIGYDYVPSVNGAISGYYDGRDPYASGFNTDLLLRYNFQGFQDAGVYQANLTFKIDSAYVNSDPNPAFYADLLVTLLDATTDPLGVDSYDESTLLSQDVSVQAGVYGGSYEVTFDVTNTIINLINSDASRVDVLLQTFESTTLGPMLIFFSEPPTLTIESVFNPNIPVPEGSSIVHLGISLVGLAGYRLFRKVRS
jgi:hypothetical protein